MYKVYAKIENERIVDVNSDAFLQCFDGWAQIDEGAGDKYHHAKGNYFDKPITNNPDQTHNYRYDGDGKYHQATDAELAAELAEIEAKRLPAPPSLEQQIAGLQTQLDSAIIEMYERG